MGIAIGVVGIVITIVLFIISNKRKREKPKIEVHFHTSTTNYDQGIYHFNLSNLGHNAVQVKKVCIRIWHPEITISEFDNLTIPLNKNIPPHPGSIPVSFKIPFSKIHRQYSDNQILKIMKMQPTFIVEDDKGKEYEFPSIERILW